MNLPVWQWNEIQQVGTDYADAAEVERYEHRMGEFRNLAAEDAAILATLALPEGSHILEIGTGSGHFARAAAKAGCRVTAVDVSPAMLEYAKRRAESEGLNGITYCHGGFLTLSTPEAACDAAVTVAALHHLPDLWKAKALQNIRRALKLGGRLLLRDVVFSSKPGDESVQFDAFVRAVPEGMREAAIRHIAQEYSTFDWIMEGLLTLAGLRIQNIVDTHPPLIEYLCEAV
jgi:ubiquinone/menaquinone biosynthesis C-methylase UbiE